MNRRNFLKSLTTVCGVAVVCPGELLKTDPWIRAAALRKKNAAIGRNIIIIKARQQGCTNSALAWKNYYADHQFSDAEMKEQIEKFRVAFKIHPFEPPFRW